MTTRYDAYPEHPLYGVPQEVLDVAREVMDEAVEVRDVTESVSHPLADAVVSQLVQAGYITWPGKGVKHIHGVESSEERERRAFDTEPTISKYPLVRWPKHAFPPGDPGFDKDGGTLDFGVENVSHVVLPEAIDP